MRDFWEGVVTPLALGPGTECKVSVFFVPAWQIFGFQSILCLSAVTMRISSHFPGGMILNDAWEAQLCSKVMGWCTWHFGEDLALLFFPSLPVLLWYAGTESRMSTLTSTPSLDPEMTLWKHFLSLPVDCREGRRAWGWDSRALGQAASPQASASCHPVLVWKLAKCSCCRRGGEPQERPPRVVVSPGPKQAILPPRVFLPGRLFIMFAQDSHYRLIAVLV